MALPRTKPHGDDLEPWEVMEPAEFFALAYSAAQVDSETPSEIPPMDTVLSEGYGEQEGWTVWPQIAGNLLGAKDLHELVIVQQEDPGPPGHEDDILYGVIYDNWDEFSPTQESVKDCGYAQVQLGTLYGIPAVQFWDTGYAAYVFRRADVAPYLRPEREAQVDQFVRGFLDRIEKEEPDQ